MLLFGVFMRGRKRKPSHLKVIQGTARADRQNPNEPQPKVPDDVPRPPRHLKPMAKAFWKANAPDLYNTGLLTQIDLVAFESMSACYANWRAALDHIEQHGYSYVNDKGQIVKNPMVSVYNSTDRELLSWLAHFGMTPSSRSGISVKLPDNDGDNPWSKF